MNAPLVADGYRMGDRIGVRIIVGRAAYSKRDKRTLLLKCSSCDHVTRVAPAHVYHLHGGCHACGEGRGKPRAVHTDRGEIQRREALVKRVVEQHGLDDPNAPWEDSPVAQALCAELGRLTLNEVGILLGVSRERVRQIEARALHKCELAFRRAGYSAEDATDADDRQPASWLEWAGRL